MRFQTFTACLVSALTALTAAAQDPAAPGSAPAPAAFPGTDSPPAIVIHANERIAHGQPFSSPLERIAALWRRSAASAAAPDSPSSGSEIPGAASAGAPDLSGPAPDGPSPFASPAGGAAWRTGRLWVNNELLIWAVQGQRLPPLVTTSPTGTPAAIAGVIGGGAPTGILNPSSVDNGLRLGWRATVGTWLDDDRRYAVEAQFLLLANGGNVFSATSTGDPILARPVINVITGTVAEPIAVPGVSAGSIRIANTNSGLLGTGIWIREAFHRSDDPCDSCRPCGPGGCGAGGCGAGGCGAGGCGNGTGLFGCYTRFDSLFGFRYLRMSDHLAIDDAVTPAAGFPGVPAGGLLQRSDRFDASNRFYGVDLGMTGEILRGPWSVDLLAKVAVGFNNTSADISGFSAVNGVVTPGAGGLLAQPTNIGHYTRTLASAVPELGLRVGYQVTPGIRVSAGYTFLYWFDTAHAANMVNNNIDPAFLTQGVPTGVTPTSPARGTIDERNIWVQGVNVGLEWRY